MTVSVQACELVESVDPADDEGQDFVNRRVGRALKAHFQRVWRVLRRCGLEPRDADEAAQDVFCVLARRNPDVPDESELAFLVGTAVKIAADRRKARRRLLEVPLEVDEHVAEGNVEDLVALRRARRLLDEVLDGLPQEQRAVFVLLELEQLTAPQAALALGVPVGTVSSRLRTARRSFDEAIRRIHLRERHATMTRNP